jgi:hypothetical protein
MRWMRQDSPWSSDASWRSPRVWGIGEDPLAWSFAVFRVGWLSVRMHVIVPLWVGVELAAWAPRDGVGLTHVAAALGAFVLLSLIREVSRACIRRAVDGEAQVVVLWPLGGLGTAPIGRGARPFLAEMGGLATSAVLVPILGALVLATGAGWGALGIDPLSPRIMVSGLRTHSQVWAWWAYYANALMLVTNALLPCSPMDAGRLAALWALSRRMSVRWSVLRIGVGTGLGVFLLGALASEIRLMALGAIGAWATYLEVRRAEFIEETNVPLDARTAPPITPERGSPESDMGFGAPPREPRLDDVLAKISRSGMSSLTPQEREVLRRETERRRRR